MPILAGLADELARTGFAAKAIAVLKRIDKIDPGRADVTRKLAALIEAKPQAPARAEAPRDFREIGISLPPRAPAPLPIWPPPPEARTEEEPLVPGPPLPMAPLPIAPPAPVEPEAIVVEPELLGDLDLSLETLVPTEAATGDVVKSPLFSDFSSAELLAVIGGLRLLTFSAGDIVITEGEPGTSLFVLTTGRVKVFVRNPAGRHVQVREMEEGEFFGEISLLRGGPRTATITAASRLELLELDRATLDAMTPGHPGVIKILTAFCHQRAGSADEALVRGMPRGAGKEGKGA